MLRHDVQPGKLVAGFFLLLTAVIYAGDAGDAWDTPWFVAIPVIIVGLFLAGVTAFLTQAIRHRRTSPAQGAKAPRATRTSNAETPDRSE
ncbi:hypothetical protein [Streptomyces poonensis]|uniref:Uncharacterized protein n=1 Tax=Streptomyces poonensis TaxID=68255 RepID=A0A918UDN6_9ACTN|nr:hypothetical protein [Streptomyces poonensis]GGY92493.1 hypothetical protein GCM10010365_08790 [Streptomyces poonensis]GLJ87683.1 hypothetical protein GCM10017589_02830 [Streptomyces poonensis]